MGILWACSAVTNRPSSVTPCTLRFKRPKRVVVRHTEAKFGSRVVEIFSRVDSPKDATWKALPHGEVGLQAPSGDFTLGEEPHIMQVDSKDPSRVFCLWRCEVGRIACAYSSDGGCTL